MEENNNNNTITEVILKFVPHSETNNDGLVNDIKVFKFIVEPPIHYIKSHREYATNYISGYMNAMQNANPKLWSEHDVEILTSDIDSKYCKVYNQIFFSDNELGWSQMCLYRKSQMRHLNNSVEEMSLVINEKDLAETQPKNDPPIVGMARPGTEFVSDPDNE